MTKRIIAVSIIAVALAVLLMYSQWRPLPNKVSGFIEADEIRLGSRVGGRVKEVLVEEGKPVIAGQPLVVLEEFDLDERLAEAEANLAARQAELDRFNTGFRSEEKEQAQARLDRLTAKVKMLVDGPRPEEIAAAEARLQLSEAQLERARLSYTRIRNLFVREMGAVTRESVDRATEELKVAEANRQVRTQELQLLKKGTRAEDISQAQAELRETAAALALIKNGYRTEEKRQAQAARDAAQAALNVVKAQREELTVKAPVDGVVEAVELQKGDLVSAGAPVLSIMDTSHLWVRAYVPENRLDVKIGDSLSVTVDSYPGKSFQGEVTFIARQAEFTPSNVQTPEERSKQVFRIKVKLTEGLDQLRAGMAADVQLKR